MPLSDAEVRVLGALTEKERTTPDAYPLSLQALQTACNQKTSREPVLNLHLQEVQEALQRLRERGLAATIQQIDDRVPKHRHLLASALELTSGEIAVLSVLMLRGPQTPGELRSRSERYLTSKDLGSVESVLDALAQRPAPLVRNLGRRPGQNQDRWMQTFGGDEERMQPRVRLARPPQDGPRAARHDLPTGPGLANDGAETLLARVGALEQLVADLSARIGELEDRAARSEGRDGRS